MHHQQSLMAASTSERDATYAAAPAYGTNFFFPNQIQFQTRNFN
jgi:hypothetical protein